MNIILKIGRGVILIPVIIPLGVAFLLFGVTGWILQGISEVCTWISINSMVLLAKLSDFIEGV